MHQAIIDVEVSWSVIRDDLYPRHRGGRTTGQHDTVHTKEVTTLAFNGDDVRDKAIACDLYLVATSFELQLDWRVNIGAIGIAFTI